MCTHPDAETSSVFLCSGRGWLQMYAYVMVGLGQAAKAGANCKHTGSCGAPRLLVCTIMAMGCMVMEAGDGNFVGEYV